MNLLATVMLGVVFICAVALSIDLYLHLGRQWLRSRIFPFEMPPPQIPPVAGVDAKGELTTGAKYAIWRYMFSVLAVGGTIIGIIAGIAGYLIKDLANEKAIQVALNNMHAPLAERLAQFADAKSALDVAAKDVTKTDKFEIAVATKLSEDEKFLSKLVIPEASMKRLADLLATQHAKQLQGPQGDVGPAGTPGKDGANGMSPSTASVAEALNNDSAFRTKVADLLATQHAKQLQGPQGNVGPAGTPGKDGANGMSPSTASVAEALNNDSAFRTKVADLLATQHAKQLQGPQGNVGPAGTPGKDGANGMSPSTASVAEALNNDSAFRTKVAELLVAGHAGKLQGPQGDVGPAGTPGKDGANGMSPSTASVAEALNNDTFRINVAELLTARYGPQLRGKDGVAGPAGRDGTSGTSPGTDEVARLVVSSYHVQLRGERGDPGAPGKDGKDGASVKAEDVALILINKHGAQLQELLAPKPRPAPQRRRR